MTSARNEHDPEDNLSLADWFGGPTGQSLLLREPKQLRAQKQPAVQHEDSGPAGQLGLRGVSGLRWSASHLRSLIMVLVTLAALSAGLTWWKTSQTGITQTIAPAEPADLAQAAEHTDLAQTSEPAPADAENPYLLTVHVVGKVHEPGVYQMPPGSRVTDAVTAAAGATDDADLTRLNLAREILDGEQIIIPSQEDAPEQTQSSGNETTVPGAAVPAQSGTAGPSTGGLINLNTASSEELQTLPGVGPVTAAAIIEYRQQGPGFTSVEDLLKVSGIGRVTLQKLESLVTV